VGYPLLFSHAYFFKSLPPVNTIIENKHAEMHDHLGVEPGAILWLPKLRVNSLHETGTVPDLCFGHPVLVLAADRLSNSVFILILTTFRGNGPQPAHIQARGHSPYNYLPIYPAKPHIDGIPSLFLQASQKLVRDNWVYVKEIYRCPKAWLQETWDENWLSPYLSRKITSNSLHSLISYTRSKGYDLSTYNGVLRYQNAPHVSPRPAPRIASPISRTSYNSDQIRCYQAAEDTNSHREYEIIQQAKRYPTINTVPITADTPPVGQADGSSYWRSTTLNTSPHSLPNERTYLLPYAVDHQTDVRYGATGAAKKRLSGLPRILGVLTICILLCAIICGLCYCIFVSVEFLIAFGKHKIWPILSSIWDKLVNWFNGLL